MSLMNVILSQKIIPITIGIAVLLMMAALMLTLIPRIRRHRIRVAKQRAEQARLAAIEAETVALEEEQEETPINSSSKAKRSAKGNATSAPAQASGGKAAAPAAAPGAMPKTPATAPAAQATPAPATTTTPAGQTTEASPSAMADLLSSVFADGGDSERQAALMRGLSDVDMTEVLTLSQQVALQLRGGKTVTVVSSKELE